jgi:hypothetical protein
MNQDDIQKRKSTPDELRPSGPRKQPHQDDAALVRLTRKYADMIDGVDLEDAIVGDRLMLSKRDADVLVAEGWAERVDERRRRPPMLRRAHAADSDRRSRRKPKA